MEGQLGQVYLMHKVHKVNCVITIFLFDLNAIVNSTARGNDGNIGHYNDCSRSGRVAEHARNFLCKQTSDITAPLEFDKPSG